MKIYRIKYQVILEGEVLIELNNMIHTQQWADVNLSDEDIRAVVVKRVRRRTDGSVVDTLTMDQEMGR